LADPIRIVILTCFARGAASDFLPHLATHPGIEVAAVVLSENRVLDRSQRIRRRLTKIRRIGVLGALTGLYLRRWNDESRSEDLFEVAGRLGVPVHTTPACNCERTRELFRRAEADLGLALGTVVLRPRLFDIPKHGMVNVHGSILPRFRGGTSVLWEIYEGHPETGFSIHQIDRGIDTGPILAVETFPIEFGATLRETYRRNVAEIRRRVPARLVEVVAGYHEHVARAQRGGEGKSYTTPTFGQFLRMVRQHRRMRRAAGGAS